MKKKFIKAAIAFGVTAAAVAALVPFKVEKDESEKENGKTMVKLKALSYALDVTVAKTEGVDISLKVPGVTNISLVNVEKHIDLPKPDDEAEDDDFGEELETDEEFDLVDEIEETAEDIGDAAVDVIEEAKEAIED